MRAMPYQRFWLKLLGLGEYHICYPKVNPRTVFDAEKGRTNNSFIGSLIEHGVELVSILHSRGIGEPEVLHELIELLHPSLPHQKIDIICDELIAARGRGNAKELVVCLGLGLRG